MTKLLRHCFFLLLAKSLCKIIIKLKFHFKSIIMKELGGLCMNIENNVKHEAEDESIPIP